MSINRSRTCSSVNELISAIFVDGIGIVSDAS